MTFEILQKELMECSAEDRARLIDFLYESLLPEEVRQREHLFAVEAERRLQECESGRMAVYDVSTVISEVRKSVER